MSRARALTLEDVRDMPLDRLVRLGEDILLDLLGDHRIGTGYRPASQREVAIAIGLAIRLYRERHEERDR